MGIERHTSLRVVQSLSLFLKLKKASYLVSLLKRRRPKRDRLLGHSLCVVFDAKRALSSMMHSTTPTTRVKRTHLYLGFHKGSFSLSLSFSFFFFLSFFLSFPIIGGQKCLCSHHSRRKSLLFLSLSLSLCIYIYVSKFE